MGGADQALEPRLTQPVAGQILELLAAGEFGELRLDLAADGGDGSAGASGQRAVAVLLFALVQAAGFLLADVEHVKHGLLREKLEAADALFVLGIEGELA